MRPTGAVPGTVLPSISALRETYTKVHSDCSLDDLLDALIDIEAANSAVIEMQKEMNRESSPVPIMYYRNRGFQIKRARKKKGWDYADVEKNLGIRTKVFIAIEKGEIIPTRELAMKLHKTFGIRYKCPYCGNIYK